MNPFPRLPDLSNVQKSIEDFNSKLDRIIDLLEILVTQKAFDDS